MNNTTLNESKLEKDVRELTIDGNVKVLVPKAKDLLDFSTKVSNDPGAVDLYELELSRIQDNPPSIQAREAGYNLNRSISTKGQGPYQILVRAERQALKDGLSEFYEQLPTKNHYTKSELLEMVDFLPNARFGYLNKLIKRALQGLASRKFLITTADVNFVRTIWLNDRAKEILVRLLTDNLNPAMDGYSIEPVQSRSRVRFSDAPGINTGQYIALKNPGNVYLPYDNSQINNSQMDPSEGIINLVKRYNKKIEELQEELDLALVNQEVLDVAPKNSELSKLMIWMMDKLADKHVTMKELQGFAEKLHNIISLKRGKFFMSLANPWKHRSARIPSLINPPSAVFSIRGMLPLTTNANGNVSFCFNPFYLSSPASGATTFCVNNNALLTGSASSNFFLGQAVGQELPALFYVRYRLVSAGLRMYCYPSSNNDNGISTISVTFEDVSSVAAGVANALAAQFGDFNQIENGYFKQTTTVASREVQEHVYIPIDESFFDYRPVDSVGTGTKAGFAWIGYISGAQPNTTIARVEFVCNIEAMLDNQYTDYLPTDSASDEIEPKNIPVIVSKIKNLETLKPRDIENVLSEENLAWDPKDVIELPTPPKRKKEIENKLKKETMDLSDNLRDFLPSVPKPKQTSIIGDIMDIINPIASSVIQGVASRYVPMLPQLIKF